MNTDDKNTDQTNDNLSTPEQIANYVSTVLGEDSEDSSSNQPKVEDMALLLQKQFSDPQWINQNEGNLAEIWELLTERPELAKSLFDSISIVRDIVIQHTDGAVACCCCCCSSTIISEEPK